MWHFLSSAEDTRLLLSCIHAYSNLQAIETLGADTKREGERKRDEGTALACDNGSVRCSQCSASL